MSVSDMDSGIVTAHIAAIEKIAQEQNAFIFIRPTEYDATVLIEAGFATKSMDIHDKSSNWGPMAGTVPCDQALSKKYIGKLDPSVPTKVHAHGEALPMQLFLKQATLKKLVDRKKIKELKDGGGLTLKPDKTIGKGKAGATNEVRGSVPTHKFYQADGKIEQKWAAELKFCLILNGENWLVYWVDEDANKLVPVFVWGYKTKAGTLPVTGDYDLWLVAPHMSMWKEHAPVKVLEDIHGNSTASEFTQNLITALNKACGRSDNTVFNHGAEAQNYAFTQPIDQKIVMFTPAGKSRIITRDQLPAVMSDATHAGYLVIWNKRYGQLDPHLMGKGDELDKVMKNLMRRNMLRDMIAQFKGYKEQVQKEKEKADGKVAKALWKVAITGVLKGIRDEALKKEIGDEKYNIFQFHESLQEYLQASTEELRVLKEDELPAQYAKKLKELENVYKLLPKIEKKAVKAATGGGETDESLTSWFQKHAKELDPIG